MPAVQNSFAAFLNLDTLTPNQDLALTLPEDVARRYQALPVAQDNGRVTVVMANPGDQAARQAVVAALMGQALNATGSISSVTVVQGDPAAIDSWVAQLWPQSQQDSSLSVWLREPLHGAKEGTETFAENVTKLLGATLCHFNPVRDDLLQSIPASADTLVILPCADYTLRNQLLQAPTGPGPAVLIGCRARWPLHKLLVIVRGDQVDDRALAWAARLARPSDATVTALMVAPPASPGDHEPPDEGLSTLLATTTVTGRKMKHAAERFAALQLDGTLHLRQGTPETVIREEMAADVYDLVITGLAVRGWEARWRLRPLLDRLLLDLACPLFIVKA